MTGIWRGAPPESVTDSRQIPETWGLREVDVRFGRQLALQGVSLTLPAREVTAVVGGDGAGKTTSLRALAGLVPVDQGEVRRPAPDRIGYLASTSGTYPDLTVDENLDFAATAYGVPVRQARERAAAYLDRTGLTAAHDRLAGNLSGGMRQKLGVIRALLHRPDLLVLDEPTTGIDPVSRVDLWWLIARVAADGAAVAFTTTYLDEAERAANLLVLDDGQPLAQGSADEILAAMPGSLWSTSTAPDDELRPRAWRRGGQWRVWSPPGEAAPPNGQPIVADLQDVVTVLSLARDVLAGDGVGGLR